MGEFEPESRFNKKYSIVTKRILRLLSNNSRISVTEMAKKLGLSRRTTAIRLKKVEEVFHINYTLDLNEEKLGFESPNLILVKFLKKADLGKLRAAIGKSPIIQFAATVKGSYDMIVYANARTPIEYMNWDRDLRKELLSPFRAYWDPSQVAFKRFGYFPLRNEALDQAEVPEKYGEMLKILNTNSRISFNELAKHLGVNYKTTVYTFNKLVHEGYINKFTVAMDPQENISFMTMFSKFVPPEDYEGATDLTKKLLTSDDEDSLITRYLMTASLVGSYDFFTLSAFDDYKTAYKYAVKYYKNLFKKFETIRIEYGAIKEILVGKLPIRSMDSSKEFRQIPTSSS
ncbi:MAG TPA: winged helix-turn-helix transcriptional regulator [Candidatus Aquilonibacter sp.]|nr:winged helix-turn-helix transcriptional regulator [Candidatus Aquilonibacter sp.]